MDFLEFKEELAPLKLSEHKISEIKKGFMVNPKLEMDIYTEYKKKLKKGDHPTFLYSTIRADAIKNQYAAPYVQPYREWQAINWFKKYNPKGLTRDQYGNFQIRSGLMRV